MVNTAVDHSSRHNNYSFFVESRRLIGINSTSSSIAGDYQHSRTRLDFSTLQPAIQFYHQHSLTASTHKLYSTGVQLCLSFHYSIDHTLILTSELTILLIVTYLNASAIVNATYLLENNNHYNNISLLPLGGKTPLIKTCLSFHGM